MLVNNQPRKAGRPKSNRKHVQAAKEQPRARNALIKNRETGAYEAVTDDQLVDAINSIHLRLNAIELNLNKVMRDGFHQPQSTPIAPTGNVVPMSEARKERGEAVQASVPGNEAEVLVLPRSDQPVPVQEVTPLKTGNTEPKLVGKVSNLSSADAANDPEFDHSDLARVMQPEDLGFVEKLAEAYQMTLVEASEILCREYFRREDHCLKAHGQPRKDVRMERTLRKRGYYIRPRGSCLHVKQPGSDGFRKWSRSVWLKECEAKGHAVLDAKRAHAPLVKGEAAYRKKQRIREVASRRPAKPEGFASVQAVSRKLHVPAAPTSAAQLKAAGTALFAGYQKMRKLFGMEPTVRGAGIRAEHAVREERRAAPHARRRATAPVDLIKQGENPTQAELVRRYQRAGIGH